MYDGQKSIRNTPLSGAQRVGGKFSPIEFGQVSGVVAVISAGSSWLIDGSIATTRYLHYQLRPPYLLSLWF